MKKKDNITCFINKILKIFNINVSNNTLNLLVQIFKFVIVGGIATIIDWIVFYIVYNYIGIDPLIANIISFAVAVIYNFIASVKWVFNVNKNKKKNRLFIEFMIFSIIGFLLNELLLFIGINKLLFNVMFVKIIATIIVMVFNFITRKIFLEENK